MVLGNMIYLYRVHRRMSQRALAKIIQIPYPTICRLENGKEVEPRTFFKLMNWLTQEDEIK